ncbi:MAG TPA: phage holin family protein [Opitutaceae bacterium]|nr:phage holin family protein [Opitutaceae bacterium]
METPTGILGALRELLSQALGSVRDRIELVSVELQQEKFRFIELLIWVFTVAVAGLLALLFASFTIVCVFWENGRLIALGALTLVYGVGFAAALLYLRRLIARQPRPFDGTIDELTADRECTRANN